MKFRIFVLLIFSNYLASQTELLNAKNPDDIIKNMNLNTENPLKYYDIEPNDVLWSKVVYEFIDLNEKLNFPLLFPVKDEQNKIGRKSLWRVLKEYIQDNVSSLNPDRLNTIEIYSNDDFTTRLTNSKVLELMSYDFVNRMENTTEKIFVPSEQIGGYNIKGMWYFDKKHSELKYRLLGIQPVGSNTEDLKKNITNKRDSPYFWIWYPTLREILSKNLVFNEKNNSNNISFDDLLVNRRFSSFIYKYNNVYGDREIKDYIVKRPNESNQQYQLRIILESERIKKEILDFELDMWGY